MKSRLTIAVLAAVGVLYVVLISTLRTAPFVHDWIAFGNGAFDPLLYQFFVDHFGLGYVENPWMADNRDIAKHLYYVSFLIGLLLLTAAITAIATDLIRGTLRSAGRPATRGTVALAIVFGIIAAGSLNRIIDG
jgi:ABC-type arginine/histidine transport system permease subunit